MTDQGSPVIVVYEGAVCEERATALAQRLHAPLAPAPSELQVDADCAPGQLHLKVSPTGLCLARDGMELVPDFADMMHRIKPGALQRELLVKAARVKGMERPRVVDATAGLGEDSFLLAAAGCDVTLCESDPVIAALLEDALERAAHDADLAPIAARMHLVAGNSCDILAELAQDPDSAPDVVYLDPMFPGRTKSAAVKKKFQLIHGLERPCEPDAELALMRAAMAARPRKIVVKRPVKGPHLAGVKPSHTLAGKAVRYDCIVPPRLA
ncbi:MAG: class I SAM-dependent methyltransferase [Coriobacteriaceae bacterium]|nr:class I SAM-dependent methyltransferase [Coriobacteriaceae bacterium]